MKIYATLISILFCSFSFAGIIDGPVFGYDGKSVFVVGDKADKFKLQRMNDVLEFVDTKGASYVVPFYPHKLCKNSTGTAYEDWTYFTNLDGSVGLVSRRVNTDNLEAGSTISKSSLCGYMTLKNRVAIDSSYIQGGYTSDKRLNIIGNELDSGGQTLILSKINTPNQLYGTMKGSVFADTATISGKVNLIADARPEDVNPHEIRIISNSTLEASEASPLTLISRVHDIVFNGATIKGSDSFEDTPAQRMNENDGGPIQILNSTVDGSVVIQGRFTMNENSRIVGGGTYISKNAGIEIVHYSSIEADLTVKDYVDSSGGPSRVRLEFVQATGPATISGNVFLHFANLYGGTFNGSGGHGIIISQSDIRSPAEFEGHFLAYFADFVSGTYKGYASSSTIFSEIYLNPEASPRQKMIGNEFQGSYFILQPTTNLNINPDGFVAAYPRAIGIGDSTLGDNVTLKGYVGVWEGSTVGSNATIDGWYGNNLSSDRGILVNINSSVASGVTVSGVVYLGTSHINNSISMGGWFPASYRWSRLHFSTVPSGVSLSGAMYAYGIYFRESHSGSQRCDLNNDESGLYTCTDVDGAKDFAEISLPKQYTDPYYDELRLRLL